MKKLHLFILGVTLTLIPHSVWSETSNDKIDHLLKFYQEAVKDTSNSSPLNAVDSIFMTTAMQAKAIRMWNSYHFKPLFRTTDINPSKILNTLQIIESSNNWFFASFHNNKEKEIIVPIHMNESNKVDFITPSYLGNDNCDCLLESSAPTYSIVNDTEEATKFLQSFYYIYARTYCTMQDSTTFGVNIRLLRELHLTPQAVYDFTNIQKAGAAKGWPGYDAVIDEYDFDTSSLKYIDVNAYDKRNAIYKVSFPVGETTKELYVKLFNDDGVWKIDNVSNRPQKQ